MEHTTPSSSSSAAKNGKGYHQYPCMCTTSQLSRRPLSCLLVFISHHFISPSCILLPEKRWGQLQHPRSRRQRRPNSPFLTSNGPCILLVHIAVTDDDTVVEVAVTEDDKFLSSSLKEEAKMERCN